MSEVKFKCHHGTFKLSILPFRCCAFENKKQQQQTFRKLISVSSFTTEIKFYGLNEAVQIHASYTSTFIYDFF